jgi:hypothetical protein
MSYFCLDYFNITSLFISLSHINWNSLVLRLFLVFPLHLACPIYPFFTVRSTYVIFAKIITNCEALVYFFFFFSYFCPFSSNILNTLFSDILTSLTKWGQSYYAFRWQSQICLIQWCALFNFGVLLKKNKLKLRDGQLNSKMRGTSIVCCNELPKPLMITLKCQTDKVAVLMHLCGLFI